MADIAEIGFKANTSDLDKATLKLNSLKMASRGVENATSKVSQAVQGSSKMVSQATLEIAKAARLRAQAELAALTSSQKATKQDITAAKQKFALAKAEETNARSILATAKANETLKRATESAVMSQTKQLSVMQRINQTTGVSRGLPKSARESASVFGGLARDQMPNRFNTANLAAQFQDIGVTAAMGMNPLTIALQQGTQISAVLNSMGPPLAGLVQAFKSIINPVSLMTIGIVALVAAGIQFINWASVGKTILMGLATAVEVGADAFVAFLPAITAAGIALLLWNIPSIISGVITLTKSVYSLTAAMWTFAAANPFGLLILGMTAALAGLYVFRDEVSKALGFDVLDVVRGSVNFIIGAFVGAGKVIEESWSRLPSALGYIIIETANNVLKGVENMINSAVSLMNNLPGIDYGAVTFKPIENGFADAAGAGAESIKETMNKALYEVDYVGTVGEGITKAARSGAASIRGYANTLGLTDKKKKNGKTEAERYEDLIGSTNRRINSLKAEQASLGLTVVAAAALRYEQDLINDAQQKNINLSPQQREELHSLAGAMAEIEEETRKTKESMDFANSTTKSLFKDMRSSLQEGKSLWESFADSVINALNKILDKMMEVAVENLFLGQKSSGGGLLSSVLGSVGSLFGGVTPFAKGGAFTNGIYSSPTMFQFANGGAFGQMGEAGPEAVMPLHRGSDGSLGVKVSGNKASSSNTYNIDARGADVGAEQRIRQALVEIERLRKDTPEIAIRSVKDANDRNLGFFR